MPAEFAIDDLFSALRGMLRPLLVGDAVALRFEPAAGLPALCTDEAQGIADPAQLHLQRAQVHRGRQRDGVRARRRCGRRGVLRRRHRHRHRRPTTRNGSSRSSCRCEAVCRGASKAPASAFRCAGVSRPRSAAKCPSKAHPAPVRASSCGFRCATPKPRKPSSSDRRPRNRSRGTYRCSSSRMSARCSCSTRRRCATRRTGRSPPRRCTRPARRSSACDPPPSSSTSCCATRTRGTGSRSSRPRRNRSRSPSSSSRASTTSARHWRSVRICSRASRSIGRR